jgi:hypothetical protein
MSTQINTCELCSKIGIQINEMWTTFILYRGRHWHIIKICNACLNSINKYADNNNVPFYDEDSEVFSKRNNCKHTSVLDLRKSPLASADFTFVLNFLKKLCGN